MIDRKGIPLTPGNNPNRKFVEFESFPHQLGVDNVFWGPTPAGAVGAHLYGPDVLVHFGFVPVVEAGGFVEKTYAEVAEWIGSLSFPAPTSKERIAQIDSATHPTLQEYLTNSNTIPAPVIQRIIEKDMMDGEKLFTASAAELQSVLGLATADDGTALEAKLNDLQAGWTELEQLRETLRTQPLQPPQTDPNAPFPKRDFGPGNTT